MQKCRIRGKGYLPEKQRYKVADHLKPSPRQPETLQGWVALTTACSLACGWASGHAGRRGCSKEGARGAAM